MDLSTFIFIGKGAITTLQYTFLAVIGGIVLGLILSLMKLSHNKFFKIIANVYISIFRGTPILVQLSIIYYVLPELVGIQLSAFVSGVIAFSMNSGAYVSEIIRSGIQSIDKGQFEAAQVLKISKFLMWKDIILPQALHNIAPALVNEIVNMIKETAIIAFIGGMDIMHRVKLVSAEKYTYIGPLLIAALYYYILVNTFAFFAKKLERNKSW